MKYVAEYTDKVRCLRKVYCEIYIVYNGLKYHKIRCKSQGNNLIELFSCVQAPFGVFLSPVTWNLYVGDRLYCVVLTLNP